MELKLNEDTEILHELFGLTEERKNVLVGIIGDKVNDILEPSEGAIPVTFLPDVMKRIAEVSETTEELVFNTLVFGGYIEKLRAQDEAEQAFEAVMQSLTPVNLAEEALKNSKTNAAGEC